MTVRFAVPALLLASSLALAGSPPLELPMPSQSAPPDARVERLMRATPLVDGHNDLPWAMRSLARYDLSKVDIRRAQRRLQTDIPRLRQGRLGAQFWSVYVPATLAGRGAVTATLEQIDFMHQLVRRYPDVFEIARTADDVERVFRAGRIASMAGVEGGHSIDSSLATLRTLHTLGARYMTLTHTLNTPWADAATDTPAHDGLTPFGEAVVAEMNWLGMLVDLSHVSPATMDDVLRVTEAPAIFSHSSARAVCDVPRNVPDAVLRQLPRNGGVVMVSFVPSFTAPEAAPHFRAWMAEERRLRERHPGDEAAVTAAMREWARAHPEPPATLAQVADHIDHVRRVAGIDHVGIGSDFDGIESVPAGLEDVSAFPRLVGELLRRGYTDEEVGQVIGGNVLRVMRRAEEAAARLQAARGPSNATIDALDGKAAAPAR